MPVTYGTSKRRFNPVRAAMLFDEAVKAGVSTKAGAVARKKVSFKSPLTTHIPPSNLTPEADTIFSEYVGHSFFSRQIPFLFVRLHAMHRGRNSAFKVLFFLWRCRNILSLASDCHACVDINSCEGLSHESILEESFSLNLDDLRNEKHPHKVEVEDLRGSFSLHRSVSSLFAEVDDESIMFWTEKAKEGEPLSHSPWTDMNDDRANFLNLVQSYADDGES